MVTKIYYRRILGELRKRPIPCLWNRKGWKRHQQSDRSEVQLEHDDYSPTLQHRKDEATGIVSFDYLKDFKATGIENTLLDKDETSTPTEYFDLEGRKIATPLKGHLYITNKGKKVIY